MSKSRGIPKCVKEDIWIDSICSQCFGNCPIRVHRVDGVVVAIEGNPKSPNTKGAICPRGASGVMLLYDPNRVNVPLKRTNPEKGIGVDPQFVEITWDEALDTITEKLKKVRNSDPRKLIVMSTNVSRDALTLTTAFGRAFGTVNMLYSGAGIHCGNGEHLFSGLMRCAWTRMPDSNYLEYYLNFGCPSGYGAYYCATGMAHRMADARVRGMKHVAVEPWMGMPAVNADEWVPLRPGTDGAFALGIINLLLNEYDLYDKPYLKNGTNGPYVVMANGLYLRDKASGKPLLWDLADSRAKTYDDLTLKDSALEGVFRVNGKTVKTAFTLLKEHVKKYTPEVCSRITTIPVDTIRRVAKEFGEAAHIGETITIDGKELPYRPVAVGYFRGAAAHRHAALTCMSLEILQEIVGANNVPGSILGLNSRAMGYPETGHPSYCPFEGKDGLIQVGAWRGPKGPWPLHDSRKPERLGLEEIVPTSDDSPLTPWGIMEAETYGIPYKPEMMIHTGANYLMTLVDPNLIAKAFKDMFTVALSIYIDESAEFADIVLPDTCYLERLDLKADYESSIPPIDTWSFHIRQPAIAPMHQRRQSQKVMLELAERLGMLGDLYEAMNVIFDIKAPCKLEKDKKYTWEEIVDRRFKGYFGPKHGLEWFKKYGLISWPKKVEEMYWRPFVKARVPIYFEAFITAAEQMEKVKKEHNIPGFDTADFQALPDWKPCKSHEEKRPGFDFYGIYYRVPYHTFTFTYNNPWLDDVSRTDPYVYNIAMNTATAAKKGFKDGDAVLIESAGTGSVVEGRIRLTEGIHPEVVAYVSGGGHWAKRLPIASQKDKGILPQWLLPLDWDHLDVVTLNLDLCVKVKITRKPEGARK
jgi:anaerobic selenocysteine-containing dehydrogenase